MHAVRVVYLEYVFMLPSPYVKGFESKHAEPELLKTLTIATRETATISISLFSQFQHHIRNLYIPLVWVLCLIFHRHFENDVLLMVRDRLLADGFNKLAQPDTRTDN